LKGADTEQTLADSMTTLPATNATCDLSKLAWNYTHLTTPALDPSSSYTLNSSSVPSGLFVYYSCVASE
jgi:hypothetical protein